MRRFGMVMGSVSLAVAVAGVTMDGVGVGLAASSAQSRQTRLAEDLATQARRWLDVNDLERAPVVTGAPFSAQVVTEAWIAADGEAPLSASSAGMLARDEAGRTRQSRFKPAASGASSEAALLDARIADPGAGTTAFFAPDRPSVSRYPTAPRAAATDDLAAQLTAVANAAVAGGLLMRPDGSIPAEPASTDGAPPAVERLPARTVDGIAQEGARFVATRTTPAGATMSVVTEVWYAPALRVAVEVTRQEGELGLSYRLEQLKAGAPPAAAFELPAGVPVEQTNARPSMP